jgi:hypothetical protein
MANDTNVWSYNIVQLMLDVAMWCVLIQGVGDVFQTVCHTVYTHLHAGLKTHHIAA